MPLIMRDLGNDPKRKLQIWIFYKRESAIIKLKMSKLKRNVK